ncbi:rhomboid family intramembrane serine protease [Candidatus Fermentibacteria bacterium]|nr:rhomboid family intramembrane serine protease [Candidatus Fermentibacteria bacterium]
MTAMKRYQIRLAVSFPPMVRRLILATATVYLFQVLTGHRWDGVFGLVPAMVVSGGALWQLVTYALQHAGPMHLLWNMLVLWMFGTEIEIMWGSGRLVAYYVTCAFGAAVGTVLMSPSSQTVTVGASGAIFGILLAFAVLFPERRVAFMLIFPMKAKYFMIVLAGLQLVLFAEGQGGVAYVAHLAGLFTGAIWLAVAYRRVLFAGPRHRKWPVRPRLSVVPSPRDPGARGGVGAEPGEVDRILDKISDIGISSLTDRERSILEQASKVLERRENGDA